MKSVVLFLFILLSGFYSNAQKIKYKDLYVLLRAKNYKDASSFLVKFLNTNPDHPNANYQMGLMLEFGIDTLNLLTQSDAIIGQSDSAISYFNKAYKLITPKDVKKHDDDYYELFKRRNLRTGKFEVILSDVQLDIENRKNELESKKSKIILLNSRFNDAVLFYNKASDAYMILRNTYKDVLSLEMGAVDSTLSIINILIQDYDSALASFKEYKSLKKSFDDSFNTIIITNEIIENFTEKALYTPDFYGKKVNFYNFSEWGNRQLEKIKEQKMFIENIINFDKSLENIASRIKVDSLDLRSEIFKKVTSPILKDLKLQDPESFMTTIFQYKISQLNYNSTLMSWYNLYADTLDVGIQLDFVGTLSSQLEGVTKLEAGLHQYNRDIFWLRYHALVMAEYGSEEELLSFINKQKALLDTQGKYVDSLLVEVKLRDAWGYWNQDTISLTLLNNPLVKYHTFYADSLQNSGVRLAGLTKVDGKDMFFFGTVPSSRVVDTLYFLETTITPLDLKSPNFLVAAQNTPPDAIIYLVGILKGTKYELQLIDINNLTGVIWANPIELNANLPPQLTIINNHIKISQGDVSIQYQLEDGQLVKE